jgi:predicted phage terminase large subunit-like protein
MRSLLRSSALQELLTRRQARQGLIPFSEYTNDLYAAAPHHRRIAYELERVERGEIDRLMLMLPPRHGKSELASRRFPAFALGRNPSRQLISVSATSDLAADFGREVRNIMSGDAYRALFPEMSLAADSQAKGKWHTTEGGIYYSVGVGGAVLGKGADILLIDDPFASMEDAMSETRREAVWQWYGGTAYNRLQPGGAIIIIGHRMAEDDLQGRLLEAQAGGGDQWTVVELPAISEANEPLWEAAYPLPALERIRRNTMPRYWSALYQQKPVPEEGSYFKRDWFHLYDRLPAKETLRFYGGSDYAVTQDGGDYTVHIVVGLDPDGRLYVVDLWRGQTDSSQWVEAFCDLVRQWRPLGWAEETGQIRSALGPWLTRRQRERQAFVAREAFLTKGDKGIRAQSVRGRAALDGIYLPSSAAWVAEFLRECLSFPVGKHDDQVDALGLVGQLLDRMLAGAKPKPTTIPRRDTWDKAFSGDTEACDPWKVA